MFREAYNLPRADLLAYFAALVMKDPDSVKEALQHVGAISLRAWILGEDTGTQGALFQTSNCLILAFRGTEIDPGRPLESYRDLKTDLLFRGADMNGATVHRGFLRAYWSVEKQIEWALEDEDTQIPLFICGHSLGGALAKLAAANIPDERIGAVYTFGAPRVGDGKIDEMVGAPLYQFIHAADLVPRVPLMLMGFRSAGDKRFITRKGKIVRSPTIFRTAGRFFWTLATRPSMVIRDHLMAKYSSAIQEARS